MKPEFLYHGSPNGKIKVLRPKRKRVPGTEMDSPDAVYASDDAAFAASFGFSWGFSEGIRLGYHANENRTQVVMLEVPEIAEHKLQHPVYIYKVAADSFELMAHVSPYGRNFRSFVPVKCLAEDSFPDMRTAVEHYGGIVKIFPIANLKELVIKAVEQLLFLGYSQFTAIQICEMALKIDSSRKARSILSTLPKLVVDPKHSIDKSEDRFLERVRRGVYKLYNVKHEEP